jgi:hypothetical protein
VTKQMAPACGTSPWLWQVAGLVQGCRFKRPGRGRLQASDDGHNNARNMLSES